MMIFGWGPRHKSINLDPYNVLVLNYQVFHIMWLFQIAWGLQYGLSTYAEGGWRIRSLTPDEAHAMRAHEILPLNSWWRWGLLITLGAILSLFLILGLFNSLNN